MTARIQQRRGRAWATWRLLRTRRAWFWLAGWDRAFHKQQLLAAIAHVDPTGDELAAWAGAQPQHSMPAFAGRSVP